jgi:multisubunit Na+/H+ antiporter MnhB subunit
MKDTFVSQIITTITALAQSFDGANTLISTYFDRGYNSGGTNAIVDDDLAGVGLTAAQLGGAITVFQQLQAFRHGGAVSSSDYDSTLNQVRRDI